MKVNLKLYSLCLLLCPFVSAGAAEQSLSSPDGRTVVTLSDNNGKATYAVSYGGKDFILPSPLGVKTGIGDFTGNLVLDKASEPVLVKDSYSLPNIKKSHVDYEANRREFTFSRDGKAVFDVIFEVSDNNVAFRYRLLPAGRNTLLHCRVGGDRIQDARRHYDLPLSAEQAYGRFRKDFAELRDSLYGR